MFGKLLVTLAIIAIAIIVIKQRNSGPTIEKKSSASRIPPPKNKPQSPTPLSSDLRTAAYLFLALMLGAAIIMYALRWQDQHTILTVNLFPPGSDSPSSYQVYKYQLRNRSFTTIDGTVITVANSERMEIYGLD